MPYPSYTPLFDMPINSPIFPKKKFLGCIELPKFGRKGLVLVIPMSGGKVPERYSSLCPSEKQFPERRSAKK
jgi:hypothetical protein